MFFLWCILAHLHPVEDIKKGSSKYDMHKHTLCFGDLEFPMKIKDIPKFEKLNHLNIDVFELTGTVLTPYAY